MREREAPANTKHASSNTPKWRQKEKQSATKEKPRVEATSRGWNTVELTRADWVYICYRSETRPQHLLEIAISVVVITSSTTLRPTQRRWTVEAGYRSWDGVSDVCGYKSTKKEPVAIRSDFFPVERRTTIIRVSARNDSAVEKRRRKQVDPCSEGNYQRNHQRVRQVATTSPAAGGRTGSSAMTGVTVLNNTASQKALFQTAKVSIVNLGKGQEARLRIALNTMSNRS